ncbi:MAG TPA: hypothetical protein VJ044_10935, partial [Candidatus Hodarchaeales archaeon]|nr:hypothetical protein [Candidatus Hodarchaeales archaeon]
MTLQVVFVGIPSTFIDTKTLDELTQSLIQGAKYDYFSIGLDLTDYSTLMQTVLSFKYLFA